MLSPSSVRFVCSYRMHVDYDVSGYGRFTVHYGCDASGPESWEYALSGTVVTASAFTGTDGVGVYPPREVVDILSRMFGVKLVGVRYVAGPVLPGEWVCKGVPKRAPGHVEYDGDAPPAPVKGEPLPWFGRDVYQWEDPRHLARRRFEDAALKEAIASVPASAPSSAVVRAVAEAMAEYDARTFGA